MPRCAASRRRPLPPPPPGVASRDSTASVGKALFDPVARARTRAFLASVREVEVPSPARRHRPGDGIGCARTSPPSSASASPRADLSAGSARSARRPRATTSARPARARGARGVRRPSRARPRSARRSCARQTGDDGRRVARSDRAPAQPWHSDTTAARGAPPAHGLRRARRRERARAADRAAAPRNLGEFGAAPSPPRARRRAADARREQPDQVRAGFARVGDACVMDSRLFHRGGARAAQHERHVLYQSANGQR